MDVYVIIQSITDDRGKFENVGCVVSTIEKAIDEAKSMGYKKVEQIFPWHWKSEEVEIEGGTMRLHIKKQHVF
jgi:hypothetical protein